jgi:hypothetical protein
MTDQTEIKIVETEIVKVTNDTMIAIGEYLIGAPALVDGIAREIGRKKVEINDLMMKHYGEKADGRNMSYNFFTHEITFIPTQNPDQVVVDEEPIDVTRLLKPEGEDIPEETLE